MNKSFIDFSESDKHLLSSSSPKVKFFKPVYKRCETFTNVSISKIEPIYKITEQGDFQIPLKATLEIKK